MSQCQKQRLLGSSRQPSMLRHSWHSVWGSLSPTQPHAKCEKRQKCDSETCGHQSCHRLTNWYETWLCSRKLRRTFFQRVVSEVFWFLFFIFAPELRGLSLFSLFYQVCQIFPIRFRATSGVQVQRASRFPRGFLAYVVKFFARLKSFLNNLNFLSGFSLY